MSASFSGVSPGWHRRRLEEGCGLPAQVQASARVDVPTAPPFFVVRTKVSNTCVHVFLREIAWIRARPTTDRDLESQRHEEVNAWPCARLSGSFDFCCSLNMVCRFRNVGFLSVRLCLFVLCMFQKVERRRVPLYGDF